MLSNSPNFSDHDFPNPGYLIICSGYQSQDKNAAETPEIPEIEDCTEDVNKITIHNSPEEQNENMSYDKLGRVNYKRTTYEPVVLKLRAMKFDTSTAQRHANGLLPILNSRVKDGIKIAFIKVDNGPDWSLLNVTNELYFTRLWKDSGLDVLGIASYAAQLAAYNNIKHLWSPMSKKLASVIPPGVLENEDVPPCQQNNLTADERKQTKAQIFSNAMTLIQNKYWKDVEFNGSLITTLVKDPLGEETPYNDYEEIHKVVLFYLASNDFNMLFYFKNVA